MLQIGKTARIVAALILSTALLATSTSGLQFANAQTIVGENMLGGLTSLRDEIVKGGNHVIDQVTKGGSGFLTAVGSNIPNVRVHVDRAYQDIIKGNIAGAGTELKELNANFLNDSSLVYGLGQELSQIAQNASVSSHSRQMLSAIGTDLKNVALNSEGVGANSTSNSTRASNSTASK
jgi:hypothetical protein